MCFWLQIGVVGWITPDTAFLSQPGPNITFLPVNTSVPACIKEMKAAESVDLVIGLSHTGRQTSAIPQCSAQNHYTAPQDVLNCCRLSTAYHAKWAAAAACPELNHIIGSHSQASLCTQQQQRHQPLCIPMHMQAISDSSHAAVKPYLPCPCAHLLLHSCSHTTALRLYAHASHPQFQAMWP